ncbi:MAG: hypothetical protein LBD27_04330 [Tannerella sp.]|jgi:hypothetical protein|nr:hypothetical protein [Tannerella sp.]
MTRAELYRWIENPTALSEKTLSDLKRLTEDYPYFHAARMLYLKNLAVTDDLHLPAELRKTAIHLPDRLKLFLLLEGERHRLPVEEQTEPEKQGGQFELVEQFLSDAGVSEYLPGVSEIYDPASATDYTYWLLTKSQQTDASEVKLDRQDLIDSFLENDEKRLSKPLPSESTAANEKTEENNYPDTEKTTKLASSAENVYFTETLAHIYIKQRRYAKALEIIKTLSLKYPEKSSYFADQIRFIEKLIIHTKV